MTAQDEKPPVNTAVNTEEWKKPRSKAQREADLLTLSSLYLQGFQQSEIGKELGISQAQVSKDLAVVYSRWRESSVINFDAAKQRELERIDEVERAYWRAWRDSRRDSKKTKKLAIRAGTGETVRGEEANETRSGNPEYLKGVQWCIEQRCKIIGINAPTKTEVTEIDGGGIDIDAAIQREIERIAAAYQTGNPSAIPATQGTGSDSVAILAR